MSDAERDERLREARHLAGQSRDVLDKNYLDDALITLDDEVTRLDAVVTAVRGLHAPFEWSFGQGPVRSCRECVRLGAPQEESAYPCPTVRALDGGARPVACDHDRRTTYEDPDHRAWICQHCGTEGTEDKT